MVAYTGIQGQNILIVSSDPANPTEGQIWYNSTSNLLKGYQNVVVNAWASGGNLNTARQAPGGTGTQTAAIAAGGKSTPVGSGGGTETELYDGTSWTNNPTGLNTARRNGPLTGTQTAAIGAGGYGPSTTVMLTTSESWNGSIWTNTPSLNTARSTQGATGTQTAALTFGGYIGAGSNTNATESWNGSSWTSLPANMTGPVRESAAAGTQTAALNFAGFTTAITAAVQSYNGSTWTSSPSMNTARNGLGGAGIQTMALGFGGYLGGGPITGATELWNGSTWTTLNAMATARNEVNEGPAGSATPSSVSTAITFGGTTPSFSAATEEWSSRGLSNRTITTS
jgi:hypothetical protein